MTCIIGIANDKGGVWVGGDSAVTLTEEHAVLQIAEPKVFRKGNVLFGIHGSLDMVQIIRGSLSIPDDTNESEQSYPNKIADAIKACIKNKGASGAVTSDIMFGWKTSIYQMQLTENGCLLKPFEGGYMAMGCSRSLAIGSLFSTSGESDPVVRITNALTAAAKYDFRVRPPFTILNLPAINAGNYKESNLLSADETQALIGFRDKISSRYEITET